LNLISIPILGHTKKRTMIACFFLSILFSNILLVDTSTRGGERHVYMKVAETVKNSHIYILFEYKTAKKCNQLHSQCCGSGSRSGSSRKWKFWSDPDLDLEFLLLFKHK